jgi:hypothetical protein
MLRRKERVQECGRESLESDVGELRVVCRGLEPAGSGQGFSPDAPKHNSQSDLKEVPRRGASSVVEEANALLFFTPF